MTEEITRTIQRIKYGDIEVAFLDAPFDRGKEAIEREGFRIISAEEQAGLRVQTGPESAISEYGGWTREGLVYIPRKGIFLTKTSPIMEHASEAVSAHRCDRHFRISDSQIESALADSFKVSRTETPAERSGIKIPTDRFAEEGLTSYLFGEHARAYGEFLRESGVREMPFHLDHIDSAAIMSMPFATQIWMDRLFDVCTSGIGGDGQSLPYYRCGIHGVPKTLGGRK